MRKINRFCLLICFGLFDGYVAADDPPTPSDVANTVSNLWAGSDLTGLSNYITNLYSSSSNYVPSILAQVFYDCAFLGKLEDSVIKLDKIQALIDSDADSFSIEFKDLLSELRNHTQREINLHQRKGISSEALQSNASPETVRSVWGDQMLPHIYILFYAPATNAP